jgi:hypothetical protein
MHLLYVIFVQIPGGFCVFLLIMYILNLGFRKPRRRRLWWGGVVGGCS